MKLIVYYLLNFIIMECYSKKITPRKRVTPAPALLAVINDYWCWRGKYCHQHEGSRVCAREKRTDQRRLFPCHCAVYKYNCAAKRVLFLYESHGRKQNYDRDYLYAEYHCHKMKGCPQNQGKVCGFDRKANFLAVFEDICTLYKANCKRFGAFWPVEMAVCEAQKSFEAQYHLMNDTFDFIGKNSLKLIRLG